MKRTLGTCYYPEHWSPDIWEDDAQRMVEAGLTWVRIGEFSWARLEPKPGQYDFDWLDRAIDVLGTAGLKVVLGTPTATPPRWMLNKHPDMLFVDEKGQQTRHGARRHYCFSHEGYRAESDVITRKLAERYGRNPHVAAWQTDNEYGCHDTAISYSENALVAFRQWCAKRYGDDIEKLNTAWGNVFWSLDYGSFDDIELPNKLVTDAAPAHELAFRRFSSDQVVSFNKRQVDIIRAHSEAPIAHNYMGRTTSFDHFKVGADLDISSWDSYPLGFLENIVGADDAHKRKFAHQGDPDFQALHHDLYRAVGRGRLWVMEQQPGPVNWAPYNPAPLPGMVRLWTWEAFAHGAEAVCYFRWRQAPMAAEQMHAGMLRPDSADAPAILEAREVTEELRGAFEDADLVQPAQAPVAIVFDYDADFAFTTQPHCQGMSYFGIVLDLYRGLRNCGLSIDILPPDTRDFTGYKAIFAPGMLHMPDALKATLAAVDGEVVYGPRTAARDIDMTIPTPLPPALSGLDTRVSYVESLRPDMPIALEGGGELRGYFEALEGGAPACLETKTGKPVMVQEGRQSYVSGALDVEGWTRVAKMVCENAGIDTIDLPQGVRVRDTAKERFWFNHTTEVQTVHGRRIEPAGVLRERR